MPIEERKNLPKTSPSIIFTQPFEIRHIARTVEISLPRRLGQDTIRHSCFIIPLSRTLRRPGPVEPAPGRFKAGHLAFCIHHQPLLVLI